MWCFIDESWHEPKSEQSEHVGVLVAALGQRTAFEELGHFMFRIRRKYYGEKNAKDLRSELKGSCLFSNASFRQDERGMSKNLLVAREVLEWVKQSEIRFVGISIYGKEKPPLLTPNLKLLSPPFRELCTRVRAHVPTNQEAHMVFDQRLGAQEEICIAIHNYLAGIREDRRLVPNPLIGVSNVWPGLQLADIAAYILGKYSNGDDRFNVWYRRIIRLQTDGRDHRGRHVYGFLRMQWEGEDQYAARTIRTKK